ncbi:hypothetical protein REPUB_Repub10bG0054800 [Reevesia pubescens]
MSAACKILIRTSLSTLQSKLDLNPKPFFLLSLFAPSLQVSLSLLALRFSSGRIRTRSFSAVQEVAPLEDDTPADLAKDTMEHLLTHQDDVARLMKMERNSEIEVPSERCFPWIGLGLLMHLGCSRFMWCHVTARKGGKRYRDNRHVSMGAEKWLDIELWNSPKECFEVLKSCGYRIATTHVGMDAVSIYDMDWSRPTAIVVGNENRGISDEAMELSDLHCSIPMEGMVDSFNVSVAAGIVMHHAVCDRTTHLVIFSA